MQKIYKITINDLTIEVIQDNDGKFIKPSIIDDYNSFGTALKPAYEPIIVARKPFRTSVAENIMKYGVGGINIDECRVGNEHFEIKDGSYDNNENQACFGNIKRTPKSYEGRFPANVIHDGSEEVVELFPDTKSTEIKGGQPVNFGFDENSKYGYKTRFGGGYDDDGSASRYFYAAKASKKDRDEGLKKEEHYYTLKKDVSDEIKNEIEELLCQL